MKIIQRLCTAALVCAGSATFASTVTLTIVTNGPANAGMVTGAGIYTNGATPTVTIQAFPGYYIKDLSTTFLESKPVYWDAPMFFNQQVATEINTHGVGVPDFTFITNDTENLPSLPWDTVVAVTFDICSPTLLSQPSNNVVVTGTKVTLSGTGYGRQPLQFQWSQNGSVVPGATNSIPSKSITHWLESDLVFTNAAPTNSGLYSLEVSNVFGVSNSVPVSLIVKDVLFSLNSQPLTNASLTATTNDFVSIQSLYTNGTIFYTLDGSTPDFNGTLYSSPFSIAASATVRAIAYSSDFTHSAISDPLALTIVPSFSLTAVVLNGGGGQISLDPPGWTYQTNTTVTVTAIPDPGWTFMGWSGDVDGTDLTNSVVMNGPKFVQAAFGTTITTTIAGNGSINLKPALPIYEYGSSVVLTAVPASSNYFVAWGNAVSGSAAATGYWVVQTNPTFSALFAPLPSGYVTLTVLVDGGGNAGVTGSPNRFPVGSTNGVGVAAYSGQEFLGWSGDATGTDQQIQVVLDSSKTVIAHFTHNTSLQVQSINPLRLSASGVIGDSYELEGTTNLIDWVPVSSGTNLLSGVELSDPESAAFSARVYRVVVH